MRPPSGAATGSPASRQTARCEAAFQRQVSSVMPRDLSAESRNGPSEPVYPKLETWPFKSGNGGCPAKLCDIVNDTATCRPRISQSPPSGEQLLVEIEAIPTAPYHSVASSRNALRPHSP